MFGSGPSGGHPVQVTAADAKEILDGPDACIVDVREDHEWQQARIAGALHIPLMQLPSRVDEIPKEGTVILVCHSGVRSLHALHMLANAGYPDLLNLQGGIVAWHQAGLPIEVGRD